MFEDLSLLRDTARHNVGRAQNAAFAAALPFIVGQMRKVFAITPANLERSRDVVRGEMNAISQRLADGRPYLVGDRFSAADLAFACMAAPVVMPAQYSAWIPDVSRLPDDARTLVHELRETPAGKHALRMFAEERRRQVAPAP
jgi:glutathione S-transferase